VQDLVQDREIYIAVLSYQLYLF